jgi:hypothetical protein
VSLPGVEAKLVFALLGPTLLVIGALRCWRAGALVAQGRIWMFVGVVFSAMAAWLWWR